MAARAWLVLAVLLSGVTCARPYPPTGGDPDVTPPRLTATVPAPRAVVAPSSDPVIFSFDDELSERGFSEALVIVSPLDGAIRVDRSDNEVRVRIDGGWRADRVYRVVLLPGVRDRFGNERAEPVELVFSTGPPVPNTALAGIVLDRITEQPALNPVIEAVRRADDVRYMAVGDSAGFFALRHLPPGVYEMRAWSDANTNRRRDPAEPVDSGRVASLTTADTVPEVFHVLAPDSTPPVVSSAAFMDSVHVRVVLDDFTTADAAAEAAAVVLLMPDSVVYATASEVLLAPVHAALARVATAAEGVAVAIDSVAADTVAADTAAADTAAVERRVDPAAVARAEAELASARELPARELVVRLERPLTAGADYMIVLTGLTNLHGLTGSGSAMFRMPERAPPPESSDTSSARAARTR